MPRIRKKTSRRQSTQHRAKIHKKAGETKRKARKQAKRDPTWKSKKKPELGVPNSFPMKNQVLAELAEEKRRNEEEKLERRQPSKNKAKEPEEDTPGIASLPSTSVRTVTALLTSSNQAAKSDEVTENVPDLVDTALTTLQEVMDRADVVLQVVDARDVQGGRSAFAEKTVSDAAGRYGLLINKADLVPREALQSWLPHLPTESYLFAHPQTTPNQAGPHTPTPIGKAELFDAFRRWSAARPASDPPLVVAFMGLPSVGKTSILNALLPSACPSHAIAPPIPSVSSAKHPQPTTTAPREVSIDLGDDVKVHIIDTPGWEFAPEDDGGVGDEAGGRKWDELEERVAGDLLRRNLGRIDRVKDPLPLASYIINRSNAQDLMLTYNVPFFKAGNVEAFLTSLARVNARQKKHGQPDLDAAARVVLRDWATNTFPYYAPPPAPLAVQADGFGGRPDMAQVLAACKSRKEMRATGRGLVRFRGGDVDDREVILDDDYTALALQSEEDEEDIVSDGYDSDVDEAVIEGSPDEEAVDGKDGDEEAEPFAIGEDHGEELDLSDGPEPTSGSDIPKGEDEEEEIESEETPTPPPIPSAMKRKRKSDISPGMQSKKTKRVSFDKADLKGKREIKGLRGDIRGKRGRR